MVEEMGRNMSLEMNLSSSVEMCYPKCGSGGSSKGITGEFVRNAESQAPPTSTESEFML